MNQNEFIALDLLKQLDYSKYGTAINADRPDIQTLDKSVGVEVTTAFPKAWINQIGTKQITLQEQEVIKEIMGIHFFRKDLDYKDTLRIKKIHCNCLI